MRRHFLAAFLAALFLAGPCEAGTGSAGHDYSINRSAAAIPAVGQNFGSSGPFANYVYVGTVPAPTFSPRSNCYVMNDLPVAILLMWDDGSAAAGAAPSNATVWTLGPGQVYPSQGGAFAAPEFMGRQQIYVPAAYASNYIPINCL